MDSLNLDPDSVDNMDMYNSIPSVLMEKCAALSVRPDTVKSLIQSMQGWCVSHGWARNKSIKADTMFFKVSSKDIMLICVSVCLSTLGCVHGRGGLPEGDSISVRRR